MQQAGIAALNIVVLVVMIFGLLSLLTTIIPGLVIIWVAALVYWLLVGFSTSAWIALAFITILMIAGSTLDNVIMGASARRTGASWISIFVATIVGLAGTIFFPPFGGLIGALLSLFLIELIRQRNFRQALNSTGGMLAGCGWAVLLRIGIGLVMILIWGGWVLLAGV
jgi:uncharacterized protein